jgi:hypothetical protein
MGMWNILLTLGEFYDHLVQFVLIWYIFPLFGIMYQEKYGNPGVTVHFGLLLTHRTESY